MKTRFLPVALLSAATVAGACSSEVGVDRTLPVYGQAVAANVTAQDAYNAANARLRSLAEAFNAETQSTITFAFDRANLDANARQALDGQARWLKANPEVRMAIVGHTDLVGGERYNDRLGLRRARAALAYLVRRGVSRKRLEALESRGEREPVVQTENRERRNRRAMTLVSGFARNFVGFGLDGEYAARIYDTYQSGNFDVTEAQSDDIN